MDQGQKVSKAQQIRDLYKQGKELKEIQTITGFSLKYIYNVHGDVKNPGILNKRCKLYLKKHPGQKRAKNLKFRKNNPEKWAKIKKRNFHRHVIATRPHATNHRQEWTIREIKYLEECGQTKTIRQLALDLGRTYSAVLNAGLKFQIDLRGNKTKTPSSRVLQQTSQPTTDSQPVLTT